ncbi:MAG: zinc ribbon domain-containing protein [Lachnospiraceae bacterium]|nr:zinc ribbon domain-containing protein [Lachnospiraceae bacterium]
MEKFCTNCGSPIEEGTLFCPECGQKLDVQPAAPATNFVAAAAAAVPPVEAAPAAAPAEPATSYSYGYGAPAQPKNEPAPAPAPAPVQPAAEPAPQPFTHENEYGTVSNEAAVGSPVVKTSAYFWLSLLFAIPVIGLIVMIIMACAAKNKNLKHWTRALLIWILVGLIISVILGLVAWIIGKNAGIELTNIDFNAIFQSLFDALGV